MNLTPLLTLHIDLQPPIDMGAVSGGKRLILHIAGGTFQGARLQGKVLPGGGDWVLADGEGVWRLDVRLLLETDDGAKIYVQYFGVLVVNEKIQAAMASGGATEYGDTHFMIQPRFETSDARYSWLNRAVTIGAGRFVPKAVEYQIFEAVN